MIIKHYLQEVKLKEVNHLLQICEKEEKYFIKDRSMIQEKVKFHIHPQYLIKFSNNQFNKLDIRLRIFLKGQFGIRRTALNQTIYLVSNSFTMHEMYDIRKIVYFIKLK